MSEVDDDLRVGGAAPVAEYDFLLHKLDDPWAAVAADRARCPVAKHAALGVFQVTSYRALDRVLRDWETFSSRGTVNSHQEEILAFTDPPRHDRQRRLFTKALGVRAVSRVVDQIQAVADELLEQAAASSTFDVVEEFANPLVLDIIARLLGVPRSDIPRFREWTQAAERNAFNPTEEDTQRLREFRQYSTELVSDRRAAQSRPDDLLTALIEAEWEDDRLTDREISNTLEFLLVAANSTTTDAIGNLVWALETHPAEKAAFLADPDGTIAGAVEEILRYEGPIHALQRNVTTDTVLEDVAIPAGAMMVNVYGACSRDPSVYEAADEFRIGRDWSVLPHHFGFGWGTHFCLGAHLARKEIAVAVTTLYRRLPNLRVVDGFQPRQVSAPFLRGWREVPVVFDPPVAPR